MYKGVSAEEANEVLAVDEGRFEPNAESGNALGAGVYVYE